MSSTPPYCNLLLILLLILLFNLLLVLSSATTTDSKQSLFFLSFYMSCQAFHFKHDKAIMCLRSNVSVLTVLIQAKITVFHLSFVNKFKAFVFSVCSCSALSTGIDEKKKKIVRFFLSSPTEI